jgi:hypothetical protein
MANASVHNFSYLQCLPFFLQLTWDVHSRWPCTAAADNRPARAGIGHFALSAHGGCYQHTAYLVVLQKRAGPASGTSSCQYSGCKYCQLAVVANLPKRVANAQSSRHSMHTRLMLHVATCAT